MSSVSPVRQMSHPTLKQYIVVATFLAIITAIEVVVIYIDALDPGIAPLLIALSGVKFATVVMFYMHLKFDSRLFTWVFVAGLALAFAVVLGMLGLFGALHADPEPREFAEEQAVPFTELEEAGEASEATGPGDAPALVTEHISTEGDALKFDSDKFTVSAGETVTLRFDNASTLFQHNWVLVQAGTKDDVAAAGTVAGPNNDWIPVGDERVIAHTKLLDPLENGEVRFTTPPTGIYQFVCTFPGHNFTMFGEFEVAQ